MSTATASPHLARAKALDAAGQHDEAINELARGTTAGDPQSTRQLGLRLLTGDRAPLMPKEGLQFLSDAADAGLPEAAARAAGILAVGVHRPADWPLALLWLCRSAELGWDLAQRQLRALCEDRELAAAPITNAAGWARLAAGISLERWRRAPECVTRHDAPRVVEARDVASPAVCDFLISLAPTRLERARVYDPVSRSNVVAPHRNNTIASFDIFELEMTHLLVQSRIAAACGVSERQLEAPSVLHYSPGEEIRNHYDFVDPESTTDYAAEIAANGQRLATFLLYLNDDYDGGETVFPRLDIRHKGSRGNGLFFINVMPDMAPDLRTLHAGTPTTRGEKWIITQFIRSRPTR
ncbi:MAG: hypothetical protein RLZZ393_992 [Pseudomonadota bacterium]